MFSVGELSEVEQYGYQPAPQYLTNHEKPSPGPPPDPAFVTALIGQESDRPSLPPIDVGGGAQASGTTFAPDSCMGKAYAALSVDDPRRINIGSGSGIITALTNESQASAESDQEATTVLRAWSTCMASRGFDAADPIDFANLYSPGSRTYNGSSQSAAIAAATADVQCKYETNYFGVMYSLVVKYQQAGIESHFAELDALSGQNSTILAKVNDVIAHG
jgi:hypothetical protein